MQLECQRILQTDKNQSLCQSRNQQKAGAALRDSLDNANGTMLTIKEPFTFELGQGFCFEARQKRIIIDDKYFFVDMVFYNRLLHCNVIIELKNDEFRHEDLGQSVICIYLYAASA